METAILQKNQKSQHMVSFLFLNSLWNFTNQSRNLENSMKGLFFHKTVVNVFNKHYCVLTSHKIWKNCNTHFLRQFNCNLFCKGAEID
jgi:hypothetical protein